MLAVVACVEPAAARYFSDWWSEHELEIRLPKLPVVLKVGGRADEWAGRLLLPVHACRAAAAAAAAAAIKCCWSVDVTCITKAQKQPGPPRRRLFTACAAPC